MKLEFSRYSDASFLLCEEGTRLPRLTFFVDFYRYSDPRRLANRDRYYHRAILNICLFRVVFQFELSYKPFQYVERKEIRYSDILKRDKEYTVYDRRYL